MPPVALRHAWSRPRSSSGMTLLMRSENTTRCAPMNTPNMKMKPSSVAPLATFALADIVDGLGLPAGAFNLVSGRGALVGDLLSSHPQVDMVSLTGSTGAGVQVARAWERAAGTDRKHPPIV